jgi:hypothetical protein
VSRASRLTQALETGPRFRNCHAANVRREAHRTAAGAAALPKKAFTKFQLRLLALTSEPSQMIFRAARHRSRVLAAHE